MKVGKLNLWSLAEFKKICMPCLFPWLKIDVLLGLSSDQ